VSMILVAKTRNYTPTVETRLTFLIRESREDNVSKRLCSLGIFPREHFAKQPDQTRSTTVRFKHGPSEVTIRHAKGEYASVACQHVID